ncbi:hypothetical protein M0R04_14840 [Candidatus Dojkabacteria bacterium]|nr:hypothetical protein [Candidatus Dojkabacteria bacterium]
MTLIYLTAILLVTYFAHKNGRNTLNAFIGSVVLSPFFVFVILLLIGKKK